MELQLIKLLSYAFIGIAAVIFIYIIAMTLFLYNGYRNIFKVNLRGYYKLL